MPAPISHARNSRPTVARLAALLLAGALGLTTAVPVAAETVTASTTDTAALVDKLADELRDYFVFPDVALRYGAAVKARQAAGAYAAITDPAALAKAITADLQAVAKDGHLRVFPPSSSAGTSGAGPHPMAVPSESIPASGWLADGVAYIRFDLFPGDPKTLERLGQFIATHAGARTLIIDARGHFGGGLAEMDLLYAHLFTKETGLAMMETRAAVEAAGAAPLQDGPHLLRQPSDPSIVRRLHVAKPAARPLLGDAKVFLLTSRRTGSAGEHLAMTLKRTHRATLIGESTYGAAHYGGKIDLPGGFWAFVPGGRSYDPDTGLSWEGTGVAPDVAMPAAEALNRALQMAGVDPAKATKPAGVS
jgi:hypothetical protein